jgi:hypothetical protein
MWKRKEGFVMTMFFVAAGAESPPIFTAFFTLLPGLIVVVFMWYFRSYRPISAFNKNKHAMNEYISNLQKTGFNISKQIILSSYFPEPRKGTIPTLVNNIGAHMGLWIDYSAKKLAARSSLDELTPTVYPFDILQDYELLEDTTSVMSGAAIGYGPVAIGGGKEKTKASNLSIRIVLSDKSTGASSVTIPIFVAKSSKVNVKDAFYEKCRACAYAMLDELGNVMRLSKPPELAIGNADELGKFKKLLDDGVLSQDEFDAKKKQLLGL